VVNRRGLLLSGAASLVPAWAGAQCVTDTVAVDACRGGVYVGGAPSLDLSFVGGTLDPRITFTRAAGPATYFDAAGVLQTAGTNVPRFDFDPVTHAPRGLLIEEPRTNLLLNSATLGTQSVAVTAQAYTLSFYGTGTVALSGTFVGSLVGAGAFPARNSLTFTPTAGTLTCTVTGSVLNANLEAGSFATSYVTTTAAAATRAADVATMPTAVWFNAAAGTLAADVSVPYPATTGQNVLAELDDGGVNTVIALRLSSSSQAFFTILIANVTQNGPAIMTPWGQGANKLALSWAGLSAISGLNGATLSGAILAVPTGLTQLRLGFGRGTYLGGWLSRVRYWPRALSATELQAATT
jgi:hypothetical protein